MPYDDFPLDLFGQVPQLPLSAQPLTDSDQRAVSGGALGPGFSPPPPPELPKKPPTGTPWHLIN